MDVVLSSQPLLPFSSFLCVSCLAWAGHYYLTGLDNGLPNASDLMTHKIFHIILSSLRRRASSSREIKPMRFTMTDSRHKGSVEASPTFTRGLFSKEAANRGLGSITLGHAEL
jgi:hypothetical protein